MENKILEIIQKENWFIAGRCWYMCYKVWKKLPKEIKKEIVLVEGDSHYWLEDKNGKIYDVYSIIGGIDDYDYSVEARYDIEKLVQNSCAEEIYAENRKSGKRKIVNVFNFINLNEAKI